MTTTVITFLLFFTPILSLSTAWNYEKGEDGPMNWKKTYTDCSKQKQSPIHIISKKSKYQQLPDLQLNEEYYQNNDSQYSVINNGHTMTITIDPGFPAKVIKGGGFKNNYKLLHFHMHWGSKDGEGSEHVIDNHNSPMELHLVHINMDKFTNIIKAIQEEEGLAVLGVMVDVGRLPHPGFQKIVDVLDSVKYKGKQTTMNANFSVTELLPCSLDMFFRYQGSLTTPPCSEAVVWTLFKEHITISHEQLEKFRSMYFTEEGKTKKEMVGNYRPLQPLEQREVLRTYLMPEDLNSTASRTSFRQAVVLLVLLLLCVL